MRFPFRKGAPAQEAPTETVPSEAAPAEAVIAEAGPSEGEPPEVVHHRIGRPNLQAVPAAIKGLRPGAGFAKYAWLPVGAAIAAVVVLVSVYSTTVQSTDATFVLMGFDPDRAQLITALIIAAMGAAAVTLVVNRVGFATVLGTLSLAALFAETFGVETQNALHSTGATGVFDAGGWVLTLVTLVVIGFVASWAGATLAAAVRPGMISAGLAVGALVKARRPSPSLMRRPIAAVLVLVLLAVTVPVFGDMVNLSPDARMLQGNNQGGGLVHEVSFPAISPIAQATATPSPTPSSSVALGPAGPSPTPTPSITAAPGSKPWLDWKPSGNGRVTKVDMLAPWIGGTKSTSEINIYTPPGYQGSDARPYPVIYEAPTGLTLWGGGTGVTSALDTLISSGQMPAAIVVFIDSVGAPYGDSECADMYDGSQWFESYITNTVVRWVEERYNVIHDPRARAIMGQSAGGFCAAMLALRHPDVFGVAISFSGYYTAGGGGPASVKPFGSTLDAHSPALLAPKLAAEDKVKPYFIIVANPYQSFYGPNATNFEKILQTNGYRFYAIHSLYTHGWPQVRYETPVALEAWSAQLVISGIW